MDNSVMEKKMQRAIESISQEMQKIEAKIFTLEDQLALIEKQIDIQRNILMAKRSAYWLVKDLMNELMGEQEAEF